MGKILLWCWGIGAVISGFVMALEVAHKMMSDPTWSEDGHDPPGPLLTAVVFPILWAQCTMMGLIWPLAMVAGLDTLLAKGFKAITKDNT